MATVDITPKTSLWMAGFAARTQPSQGTAMPLHAKAVDVGAGAISGAGKLDACVVRLRYHVRVVIYALTARCHADTLRSPAWRSAP